MELLADKQLLGLLGFVLVLLLIVLRFPVALAMLLVGIGGNLMLGGLAPTLGKFYADPYFLFTSHYLAVIPLFLLMGQFAFHSGISRGLFHFARSLLGARQLGAATIAACGLFGSICGSSLATAATMSKVAIPEMRRHHYSRAYAAGIIAAGGTLGTLIPPSIVLIIYAVLTEQNLVKMFQAALVPGLIAMLGYLSVCLLVARLLPGAIARPGRQAGAANRTDGENGQQPAASATADGAPAGNDDRAADNHQGNACVKTHDLYSGGDAQAAATAAAPQQRAGVICFFLILLAVILGIYGGFFTPAEGASIGCVLTLASGAAQRLLTRAAIFAAIKDTARTSGMIYTILLGAAFFSSFLALTELPAATAAWLSAQEPQPYLVLGAILIIYLLLGCVMDTIAMMILTLPLFFPIILSLDFGLGPQETALWFGVLVLVTVEVGLITPPLGLNIFVIASLHKELSLNDCYRGVLPYLLWDLLRIGLLVALPGLSLGLVNWLQ